MALQKFAQIEASKDMKVQSLADRPNTASRYGMGGLSAAQLKEHFDRLAEHIIQEVNSVLEKFGDSDAAGFICVKEGTSLADILDGISSGDFAENITIKTLIDKDKSLTAAILELEAEIKRLAEEIDIDLNGELGDIKELAKRLRSLENDFAAVGIAEEASF